MSSKPNFDTTTQIFLSAVDIPKRETVECIYCDTTRKNKLGHCPTCGGTVTKDMGLNQKNIGKLYDVYWGNDFDPSKVTNKETIEEFYKQKE